MFTGNLNASEHALSPSIDIQKQWACFIEGKKENRRQRRWFPDTNKYFSSVFQSKKPTWSQKDLRLTKTKLPGNGTRPENPLAVNRPSKTIPSHKNPIITNVLKILNVIAVTPIASQLRLHHKILQWRIRGNPSVHSEWLFHQHSPNPGRQYVP